MRKITVWYFQGRHSRRISVSGCASSFSTPYSKALPKRNTTIASQTTI